jgi:FtsZ-binding cell division protein ZapB
MSDEPIQIGYPGDKISLLSENAALRARVEELTRENSAMKHEQTKVSEKLQNYIAMWKQAEARLAKVVKALVAACGAIEDEVEAAGDCDHPMIRDHAMVAKRGMAALAAARGEER